jgi:hypothetical protein
MATEFHFFVKLPVELQLKIWKISIPGPKNVSVELVPRDPATTDRPTIRSWKDIYFRSYSTPPAMLSACRISREIILSTHTACIESPICHSQLKIRLDPKIDTLLVLRGWNLPQDRREYVDSQSMAQFSEIRRVAWGLTDLVWVHKLRNWILLSKLFPKLEILFPVFHVNDQIPECYQQGCEAIFTEDLLISMAFEANNSFIQTQLQNAKESLGDEDGDGTLEEKLIDVKCVTIVQPGAF